MIVLSLKPWTFFAVINSERYSFQERIGSNLTVVPIISLLPRAADSGIFSDFFYFVPLTSSPPLDIFIQA